MPDIEDYTVQTLKHVSQVLMNPLKEKRWFEKNRPILEKMLLEKGRVDPKKIFIIIDAIEYRTEDKYVPTGRKKMVGDFDLNIVESIPKTGHVKPKIQFTPSIFTNADYEKMIYKFDLKYGEKVPLDKYTQIVPFKNELETQFYKQAAVIVSHHHLIAKEFGTLYSSAEKAMLDNQRRNHPNDFKIKPPVDWSELILKFHSIFNQIQYGISPEKIERLKVFDPIFQFECIDHDLAEEISESILRHCRKREPIIEILRVLARKILPLESIVEDFNFDQEIKSIQNIWENESFIDMPDPATFAQKRADGNRNKKGSDVSVMTEALKLLRSHLVEKNYQDLDGKVSGIADFLIENIDGLRPTQKNSTVTNWINSYFEEHKSMKKSRLNNS